MQEEAAAHLTPALACVATPSAVTAPHAAALRLMWWRPEPKLAWQACYHGATSLCGFGVEPIEANGLTLCDAKAAGDSDAATGLCCHAAGCNVVAHTVQTWAPIASIVRRASCYCVHSQDRVRRLSQEVQADRVRCTFNFKFRTRTIRRSIQEAKHTRHLLPIYHISDLHQP